MFEIEQIKKAMPEATFELFTEGFSDIAYMRKWTLVGGTALSIYLHHRLSEDLDFFIEKSTLDQERTHIEKMITELEERGYSCVKTHNNSENLDFETEGVKVTFFASAIKNLKANCNSYKNIDVASVETIMVMKMEVIISYRTKIRDFYDIYTISEHKNISLFAMLDIYNIYSNKKGKEELLYYRFVSNPPDGNDEGLDGMMVKEGISTFSKLRRWVIDEILKNKAVEEETILSILENPSQIGKYKECNFGLQRISLPQKFASIGRSDMVMLCLELHIFDVTYRDISGKNLLDYHLSLEDNEVFQKILECATEIPREWLESKTYMREKKIEAIQLENSIINSVEKSQHRERMIKIADKYGITIEEYLKKVEDKNSLIKNIKESIKAENNI